MRNVKRSLVLIALIMVFMMGLTTAAFGLDVDIMDMGQLQMYLAGADYMDLNLRLMNNINIPSWSGDVFLVPAGKTVTLDLNGRTISASREVNTSLALFNVQGSLTVLDSSANQTGKLQVGSQIMGDTGTRTAVFANNCGTLTLESGSFINTGNATLAWVIDSLPSSPAARDTITNVNGGYLESAGSSGVFRLADFGNVNARNIINITDGELIGQGSVGFVQSLGGNFTAASGKMEVNISGGYLEADDHTVSDAGVIYTIIGYRANGNYTPIDINVSGGYLYSRPNPVAPNNRPTICLGVTFNTGTDGLAMMDQLDAIPVFVNITGGTLDNAPGIPNVDNAMWGVWADWFVFNPAHVFVYAGTFTYDPSPFVCDSAPVMRFTPADATAQTWYYVNADAISAGLGNVVDGTYQLVSGTYRIAAGTTERVDANQILCVATGATVVVEANATLVNNGAIRVDGGTLVVEGTIENNGLFYRISGEVVGTPTGRIVCLAEARTSANPAESIFYCVAENQPVSARVVMLESAIANHTFTFEATNVWITTVDEQGPPSKPKPEKPVPPTGDATTLAPAVAALFIGALCALPSLRKRTR